MTKDTRYFRHDANAFHDLKIKALRKCYGLAGYGFFWYLIELMRNEDCYRLPYSELTFESLAEDWSTQNATSSEVKAFIDDCISTKIGLFIKDGDYFYSERLTREMANMASKTEEARQRGSKAGKASWEARRPQDNKDPDKYTKGPYGHMVAKSKEDIERIHGRKKARKGEPNEQAGID